MKPGGGNRKGKQFERDLAALLHPIFPFARRGAQSRTGLDAGDLIGTPGYRFEAKVGRKPNARAALAQAIAEKGSDEVAVAVCKQDGEQPIATLLLSDLLALIRKTGPAPQPPLPFEEGPVPEEVDEP